MRAPVPGSTCWLALVSATWIALAPAAARPEAEAPAPPAAPPAADVARAKIGSQVSVAFRVTTETGQEIEQTPEGEPHVFRLGTRGMFPALQRAIVGMAVGDRKEITLRAEQAFGHVQLDGIQAVPRDSLPPELHKVGAAAQAQFEGEMQLIRVVEVKPDELIVDFNHPLAGHRLTYDLELVALD